MSKFYEKFMAYAACGFAIWLVILVVVVMFKPERLADMFNPFVYILCCFFGFPIVKRFFISSRGVPGDSDEKNEKGETL